MLLGDTECDACCTARWLFYRGNQFNADFFSAKDRAAEASHKKGGLRRLGLPAGFLPFAQDQA
jgi:hypothetical protein